MPKDSASTKHFFPKLSQAINNGSVLKEIYIAKDEVLQELDDSLTEHHNSDFVVEKFSLNGRSATEIARNWINSIKVGPKNVLGLILVLPLAACKSNPKITTSESGEDDLVGYVIDGYLQGAKIFIDANSDGLLDEGETILAETDDTGRYQIENADEEEPLVVSGGIDIETGVEFKGVLKAPAGSTVVTPLTTIVQEIIEADTSGDDNATKLNNATSKVLTEFGLAANYDLLNSDYT